MDRALFAEELASFAPKKPPAFGVLGRKARLWIPELAPPHLPFPFRPCESCKAYSPYVLTESVTISLEGGGSTAFDKIYVIWTSFTTPSRSAKHERMLCVCDP